MIPRFSAALALLINVLCVAISFGFGSASALESYTQHYLDGLESMRAGNLEHAVGSFDKALALKPGKANIHHGLGLLLLEKSEPPNPQQVLKFFEKLQPVDHSRDSLYWLARAYLKLGNEAGARDAAEKALDKPVGNVETVKVRGLYDQLTVQPALPDSSWPELVQNMVALAAIFFIAFLFILALKKFVFIQAPGGDDSSRLFSAHDLLYFLVIVVLLIFASLAFGWIDGGQFIEALKNVLGLVGGGE